MSKFVSVGFILILLFSWSAFAEEKKEEVFTGSDINTPFVIHGRLRCYNGNPSLRIWIVGSDRILGIPEPVEENEEPGIPKRLYDIFDDGTGWFTKEMFGDFLVEPLAEDIPGHMRPVRVLSVENLVVTLNGEVIINERTTEQDAHGNGGNAAAP